MVTREPKPARVTWTYDDLRTFPEDNYRYEIIDGELLVTPSPTTTHQSVSKRILFALMSQVEHRGLGIVFDAPTDVLFSNTRVVIPDLLVIRSERRGIITERAIAGAPDLIIEILSPGTETIDRTRKQKLYASQGVPEYWLVDISAHVIEVLELGDEGYRVRGRFGPGERVESGLFQLELPIDPIFAP